MRLALALFVAFIVAVCLLAYAIAGWLGFLFALGMFVLWAIVMVVVG